MKRDPDAQTAGRRAGGNSKLTTADLLVLSFISERPMHGYELVKEYVRQEAEDWASVSRPHVYYALQKLAEHRMIEAVDASEPEPRGKAVYRITREGTAALKNALADACWAMSRTPTSFDTWLGLSIHARRADIRRVLAARRTYLEEQIAKETHTLAAIGKNTGERVGVAAVMVGLCIEQFKLELRWLAKFEVALLDS
jgi:DNA-binding PadR family transcriptional regulator